MKSLQGRVAVVTGGASGIGYALCSRFASEGMRIVMADLASSRLLEAAEELRASGAQVLPVATDVSDWASMVNLAEQARATFGGAHIVCNNAGVRSTGPVWETTIDDWKWVLDVNLMGVVHGVKAFVPGMIERGEPGHIVNTASISGLLSYKQIGPYSASKAGVISLSEALVHELADIGAAIRVSVLCPGSVLTTFRENSSRLRPSGEKVEGRSRISPTAQSAEDVAQSVLDAVLSDRFWILSHAGYDSFLERRLHGILHSDEVVLGEAL